MFQPQTTSQETRDFFRLPKRTSKKDFINRIQGRPVEHLPYWEAGIDGQMMATILEKPMEHTSFSADPADCVELARRAGLSGIGFGLYYSPCREDRRMGTRQGFDEVRKEGLPDFSEGIDRVKRLQDATQGTDLGVWVYTHGPLDPIYLSMDLQQFWLLTLDDPKYLHEVGDYLLEVNCSLVEKAMATGIDWLHIGDDVAFKSGLMVRPDFFFDYYPQRLKRLIAPAQMAGVPVTFHSDGKINDVVDMLVDCGIDAMNPIEPYSNDIFEIAELAAGRIGLIGNVEVATLDPESAYQETRKRIDQLGSRYVPASSHSVTNDVPPETYAAFLRAIQKGSNPCEIRY